MKTILLSAEFGFQKNHKTLWLSKTFCKFKSKNYEQYLNPVIAKKRVLKEIVRQNKACKEIIGRICIRMTIQRRLTGLSKVNITQEDIDRTRREMYPKKRKAVRRTSPPPQNNMMFFHPMMRRN